jgi:hypothetical protein
MKIGLVIPVLNNFDQALDLIFSAKTKHELKIYIRPQYRYQVPLAAAWNKGFNDAVRDGCDFIIIANDDTLFAPQSIDQAVEEFASLEEKYVLYGFRETKNSFSEPFEICMTDSSTDYNFSESELFSSFMVKKDFFERCGSFDENFDPCWWEDNDMHYRIILLGYEEYRSNTPFVHIGSQTTKKMNLPINSLKSGEYYLRKWGSQNRTLVEQYKTPYNDSTLTPKDWKKL